MKRLIYNRILLVLFSTFIFFGCSYKKYAETKKIEARYMRDVAIKELEYREKVGKSKEETKRKILEFQIAYIDYVKSSGNKIDERILMIGENSNNFDQTFRILLNSDGSVRDISYNDPSRKEKRHNQPITSTWKYHPIEEPEDSFGNSLSKITSLIGVVGTPLAYLFGVKAILSEVPSSGDTVGSYNGRDTSIGPYKSNVYENRVMTTDSSNNSKQLDFSDDDNYYQENHEFNYADDHSVESQYTDDHSNENHYTDDHSDEFYIDDSRSDE